MSRSLPFKWILNDIKATEKVAEGSALYYIRVVNCKSLFVFLSVCLSLNTLGQAGFHFIENQGQWPDKVGHMVGAQNTKIFIEDQGLTYHLFDLSGMSTAHSGEKTPKTKAKGHVYKVKFIGCNKTSNSIAKGIQRTRYN